jgi:hypothetical protein
LRAYGTARIANYLRAKPDLDGHHGVIKWESSMHKTHHLAGFLRALAVFAAAAMLIALV